MIKTRTLTFSSHWLELVVKILLWSLLEVVSPLQIFPPHGIEALASWPTNCLHFRWRCQRYGLLRFLDDTASCFEPPSLILLDSSLLAWQLDPTGPLNHQNLFSKSPTSKTIPFDSSLPLFVAKLIGFEEDSTAKDCFIGHLPCIDATPFARFLFILDPEGLSWTVLTKILTA